MTKYYFIGIKGSGMSALAQILHDLGHEVIGSDIDKYFFTEQALIDKGIKIYPFNKDNIKEGYTIILGNAFPDHHEEVVEAKALGLEIIRYHDFLGDFMKQYTTVAVTGSHGKTSTTGLLAHAMNGDKATSFLIGDGTGFGQLNSEYFTFEACEYRRHFLSYYPDYAIITNVDFDHPDYFDDIHDVFLAFQQMAEQVNKALICCGDDKHLRDLNVTKPIYYYGLNENNDIIATNITHNESLTSFDMKVNDEIIGRFDIPLHGSHQILNALSVLTICYLEEMDMEKVQKALLTYGGVKRRFTEKKLNHQVLVDDYAHHPTEIRATIETARKRYPNKEIIAIFQPHTYSRTKALLNEFAESLSEADHVYLCDIFASAREASGDLTIVDLQNLIVNSQVLNLEEVDILNQHHEAVFLFMGAGDVNKFQREFEQIIIN